MIENPAATIDALAAKAAEAQWTLESAIDWRLPPKPASWLPRRWYVYAVSQFLHGERAALSLCARIASLFSDPSVTAFLATQVADETRHVRAYNRYLERLGDIAEIDAGMARALASVDAWRGSPLALIIACHILLESEAIWLHGELAARFSCPLFGAINTVVSRDEARHVAFGRTFLETALRALERDERLAIYKWACDLYFAAAELDDMEYPANGSYFRALRRTLFAKRWGRRHRLLESIGLLEDNSAAMQADGGMKRMRKPFE